MNKKELKERIEDLKADYYVARTMPNSSGISLDEIARDLDLARDLLEKQAKQQEIRS